ncbi:hypothetical protein D3C85_1683190 [compost metagenome]
MVLGIHIDQLLGVFIPEQIRPDLQITLILHGNHAVFHSLHGNCGQVLSEVKRTFKMRTVGNIVAFHALQFLQGCRIRGSGKALGVRVEPVQISADKLLDHVGSFP